MTYIQDIANAIRERVPPALIPDGNVDDLFLIYAALGLAKGAEITRRDVHNAWAAWMASHDPAHESIRSFDELDTSVKREDDPFVVAIREVMK